MARATVVAGTTVFWRMVPTNDSMVSAACTVQSASRPWGVGVAAGAGAAAGGRGVTSAMTGRLPSAAHAPTCGRRGGGGRGGARGTHRGRVPVHGVHPLSGGRALRVGGGRGDGGGGGPEVNRPRGGGCLAGRSRRCLRRLGRQRLWAAPHSRRGLGRRRPRNGHRWRPRRAAQALVVSRTMHEPSATTTRNTGSWPRR